MSNEVEPKPEPGWVLYKKLLYQLIVELVEGTFMKDKISKLAEYAGCSEIFLKMIITNPDGINRLKNSLPNSELHEKIVGYFRKNNPDGMAADSLDAVYKDEVIPELERRRHASAAISRAKAVERIDELNPQTDLTKEILNNLKAKQVWFSKIANISSIKVIEALDNPAAVNSGTARKYLEVILGFEELGFSEKVKSNLREMFYGNCRNSIRGCKLFAEPEAMQDGEEFDDPQKPFFVDQIIGQRALIGANCNHPRIEYKKTFYVLAYQAGLSLYGLEEITEVSRKKLWQITNLTEPKLLSSIPNLEWHKKICQLFVQKGCEHEDLALFQSQYLVAKKVYGASLGK